MDLEGVDVHLIIPATFATAASVLDNEMANELYDAYHRYHRRLLRDRLRTG